MILDKKPQFESSDQDKKFNRAYWWQYTHGEVESRSKKGGAAVKVITDTEDVLRKKEGVKPGDAIKDLVHNAEKYSFDCASFVQAVALYAWAAAKPDEVGKLESLNFREHASTGLSHRSVTFRNAQNGSFHLRTRDSDRADQAEREIKVSEQELLANTPIGSRISFKNYDIVADGINWERENAIKIGPGQYAAQPLGIVDAKSIKEVLAAMAIEMHYEKAKAGLDTGLRAQFDELYRESSSTMRTIKIARLALQNRENITELMHDSIDEYVDHFIALEQVEVFATTPV